MASLVQKFIADEGGATALEYGLIAALIVVVIVVLMQRLAGGAEGAIGRIAAVLAAVT